jgi:transposase
MSRFATDRHTASWTAICPGNHESRGKREPRRRRNGNPRLRAALIEGASADAAIRTRDFYLRVKRRRGHMRAIATVAHSILIATYHIL